MQSGSIRTGPLAWWLVAALLLAGVIGSCQELDVSAVDVVEVEIEPSTSSVTVGQARQLTAKLMDAKGNELRGRSIAWSSRDESIATVSSSGLVSGTGAGTTTIVATSEGRTGEATVTVSDLPVATVDVTPASVSLRRGETIQLRAVPRAADGTELAPRPASWSTSAPAVAAVDGNGLVTAVADGAATITASMEGKTGQAAVLVTPDPVATVEVVPSELTLVEGEDAPLQAIPRAADGTPLSGHTITWATSDAAIATVDAGGRVTAVAVGTATITATAQGRIGQATVHVEARPVESVQVTPASSTVAIDGTVQLTATALAADGSELSGRTFTWASGNPAVATVDANGLVRGVTLGEVVISATTENRSGTARVVVGERAVAKVELEPSADTLIVGETIGLTAVLTDNGGVALSGRPVTWTSSNDALAALTATGATATLTGLSPGEVTVTATSEGQSGIGRYLVLRKPVAEVEVSPSSASMVLTEKRQFTATVRAADDSVLTDRPVQWSSSAPAVASVDGNGLVTALTPGSATIRATAENVTGEAAVTVGLQPVASVEVLPAVDTVTLDGTATFQAVLRADNGNVLTGRTVTWSTGNPSIATVNSSGVVTGRSPGSTTVGATAEGKSGTASLLVRPKPVASVAVTPNPFSVTEGSTQQLSVRLEAADGTVLTGRSVSWSSGNTGIATVNGSGLVTAVKPGDVVITATSEGVQGRANGTVLPKPVAKVTVQPTAATMRPGNTRQFEAVLEAADGTRLTGRHVDWESGDPAQLSISPTSAGAATATATARTPTCSGDRCQVVIEATSEGVSGSATVTIEKPVATVDVEPDSVKLREGGSAPFTATLKAADGTVLSRPITWSSKNSSAVSVSPTSGASTTATANDAPCAGSVCVVEIEATSEGVKAAAKVAIEKAVANISLSPAQPTVDEGGSVDFEATVTASDGTKLTDRTVSWSSSNPSRAAVTPTGPFRQSADVSIGSCPKDSPTCQVDITASVEGRSRTATITIRKRVAAVSLDPTSLSLPPLTNGTIEAEVTASDGTVLSGHSVTWNSSNLAVATVSGGGPNGRVGTVQAVSTGTTNVTATAAGITSPAAQVTVQEAVATVTVFPSLETLHEGEAGPGIFQATLTGVEGSNLTNRVVTWTTSDDSRATVTGGQGTLSVTLTAGACPTGSESCPVTITATAEGKSGTAQLKVLKPVSVVTVAPDPAGPISIGEKVTLRAQLFAADGTDLSGARAVVWTSEDPATATVDATTGEVTAVGAPCADSATCAVEITATADGVSGSGTVLVNKPLGTPDPDAAVNVQEERVDLRGRLAVGAADHGSSGGSGVERLLWTVARFR